MTTLEYIPNDVWHIINEYLFDPKPSHRSIEYLITLESLSELSNNIFRIMSDLKNQKEKYIINQCDKIHKMVRLHRDFCDMCHEHSKSEMNKIDDMVYCDKCYQTNLHLDERDGYTNPGCKFCYDISDNSQCLYCWEDGELIDIKHWEGCILKKYKVCTTCLMDNDMIPSLHQYLSIINKN